MRSISCGILCLLALAGCGSVSQREAPLEAPAPSAAVQPPAAASPAAIPVPAPAGMPPASRGAYYKDDGPGANPPPNLAAIPDAVPRAERPHRFANRPYQVFGKDYVPVARAAPFRQIGIGSWYGRRFHGAPTSSGEPYDMYGMTAAHPTLPIPSYVRVTNTANGRSVVVRVNDRGPFHANRIIDLSYTAAWKLGYVEAGSARVEVEALLPGSEAPTQQASKAEPAPQFGTQASITEPTGFYLRLGAFSSRETAENFRVRVHRELAWLSEAIRVIGVTTVFRLHLGPYRSQDEARSIADRIQAELNLRPMLVTR
ncbi:MAG: septal ring lytic transglycosylase RlpA family protein [Candidatus Parcubacteria bacterium]|nr:septal ring lytic transglycosylase RlpA family protein [Burkholderiales bacterium]